MTSPLDVAETAAAVREGARSAVEVAEDCLSRVRDYDAVQPHTWIARFGDDDVLTRARQVDARLAQGETLPLAGVPFAVKDNLDVAGLATTAACPAFAYAPDEDCEVVARLLAAGAIAIGKTNLDQFATGLTGTRSPYGAPGCVFDRAWIAGGSSSGSAVAVAAPNWPPPIRPTRSLAARRRRHRRPRPWPSAFRAPGISLGLATPNRSAFTKRR